VAFLPESTFEELAQRSYKYYIYMNNPLSFPKEKINVLLLEGIHKSALEHFQASGYSSTTLIEQALDEDDLIKALEKTHILGIRSRTQLTEKVLKKAYKLMSVGCFCIGTNQVDLEVTRQLGIPVFNAPHSNTRSVAELVLSEMIFLMRDLVSKNNACHRGEWIKSASGSYEIRGKTLGIIGYGHIGSQLSILAESMGMNVVYFDMEPKLPMGNAKQLSSLKDVMQMADVVSLHVPASTDTVNMIHAENLAYMKAHSVLINASRGNVVDIDALANALKSKKIAGAAIDVFPKEPASKNEAFVSPLQGLNNVILTPHIGGSTTEAQVNIGKEVAYKLVQYSDEGSTQGSVNFPALSLPRQGANRHRLLHTHKNIPGILGHINKILADSNTNILGQYLQTMPDVGYVVIEVDREDSSDLAQQMSKIEGTIRCRTLF